MRTLFVRQRLTFDGPLVVFVLFVLAAIARAEPKTLALTHVTVIDGTGADPQPGPPSSFRGIESPASPHRLRRRARG